MTFDQALAYVQDALKFGIHPSLDNITRLTDLLGRPQRAFETIHVGGTNGKTSTARVAAAILKGHGCKVGLYTSPHLESYTERMEIGGRKVYPGEFASAFSRVIPEAEKMREETGQALTEFELLTAAAFVAFEKAGIDVAVLEVGLGGRWDATNVCDSKVAAITNIDLEHTDRLGATIEAIAAEKAQVIKKGATAVVGDVQPPAMSVIGARAQEVGAELLVLNRDFNCRFKDGRLSVNGALGVYEELDMPALGTYQGANTAVAIAACEAFLGHGLVARTVQRTLSSLAIPGRLEQLLKIPPLYIDGAHNPAAARELAAWLAQNRRSGRLVLVVGILSDKDVDGILQAVCPLADVIICTQPDSDRAVQAVDLAARASAVCEAEVFVHPSVAGAIESAVDAWRSGDLICVTGSLYTAGEARAALREGPTRARR